MVSTRRALISSTATASGVGLSHGVTHYVVEGSQSLSTPGVQAAGVAVFGTTFALSYLGMKGKLPF